MSGKASLVSGLALSLAIGQFYPLLVAAAPQEVRTSTNCFGKTTGVFVQRKYPYGRTSDGMIYAPMRLTVQNNTSINVEFLPPLTNNYRNQQLFAVAGVNVRGLSLSQIYKMLRGKPGDTVDIDLVGENRSVQKRKVVFVREAERSLGGYSSTRLRGDLEQQGYLRSTHPNMLESTAAPCDLFARSNILQILDDYQTVTAQGEKLQTNWLVESLILSQSMGDLKTADRLLPLLLKNVEAQILPRQGWTKNLQIIVKNLVATGQLDRALALCKEAAKQSSSNGSLDSNKVQILEAFDSIQSPEAKSATLSFAEEIASEAEKSQLSYYQNAIWLSHYLYTHRQKERALKLCQQVYGSIKAQKLDRKEPLPDYLGLTSEQSVASFIFNKAWLCAQSGDRSQARRDLESIRAYYNHCYSLQEQTILNKIPEYFPTPEQVSAAVGALDQGNTFTNPPPTLTEPAYERYAEDDSSANEGLKTLVEVYKAMELKDKSGAESLSFNLVRLCGQQVPQPNAPEYRFVRLNVFCAALGVARAFSDIGWYQSSDGLLSRLENNISQMPVQSNWREVAFTFVRAERAVNASLTKLNVDPQFDALESTYHSMALPGSEDDSEGADRRDDAWRVRLRRLAMGYYHAGDFKRAKVFIDRALIPNLPTRLEPGDPSILVKDTSPGESFLLLMDAACVVGSCGDYQSASKFATLAQNDGVKLDNPATAVILEYAAVCKRAGKLADAIAWLTLNRTAPLPALKGRLREVLTCGTSSLPRDDYGALIDEKLAELLAEQGNYKQAYKVIKESIAKSNTNTTQSACVLAAQLAKRFGDFGDAAAYFDGANWHSPFIQTATSKGDKYLVEAVAMAEKCKDYDRKALVKLYCDLAQRQDNKTPGKVYDLYKKACDITPDNDPDKARLVSLCNNYKLSSVVAQAPLSKEALAKLRVAQAEDIRKVAQLAEKNKQADAYSYWLSAANCESQGGQMQQSLMDAKHAIELFGANSADPLYSKGALLTGSGLPVSWHAAGAGAQGEALQRLAIARMKTVFGDNSVRAQWQLAQLFEYYVRINDLQKALSVFDEITMTNLNQGSCYVPDHMRSHCGPGYPTVRTSEEVTESLIRTAQSTVKEGNIDFAVKVLNKLLLAQQKGLKPNDRRLGITFSAIAACYGRAKQYKEAMSYYDKALPILLQYEPEEFVSGSLYPTYPEVLKALGKQSIKADLERRQAEKSRLELEARDKEILRGQELLKRLASEQIGLNEMVLKERSISLAEQEKLVRNLDLYHRLVKSGGSQKELVAAIKSLEAFGDSYNLGALQAKFMAQRVAIEDRHSDLDVADRRQNYRILLERFIYLKDFTSAKVWLAKLGALDANSKNDSEYLNWLEYSLKCGSRAFPTDRAQRIEKEIVAKPQDKLDGTEVESLRQLQRMYKLVDKVASAKALDGHALAIESRIKKMEKERMEARDRALKAQQEYLSQTPISRANKAFERLQQDVDSGNWQDFAQNQSGIFICGAQLSTGERKGYALRCLSTARDLIKARKGDAAMPFLYSTRWIFTLEDSKEIVASIDQTMAVALQLAEHRCAAYCAGAYADIARNGGYPQTESAALFARGQKYQELLNKKVVNDVTLANEAQVRELAKGYCIKRTIFAWKLLRINDKNDFGIDKNNKKTLDVATINGIDTEHRPLLLEDDTSDIARYSNRSPVKMAPFKPALPMPLDAVPIDLSTFVCLPAKDYHANKLVFPSVLCLGPGRTRVFINKESICNGPVVWMPQDSSINTDQLSKPASKKCTLEIWYNGEGTIRLDDRFNFSGLIYAPMARVELNGPTSGRFSGAIVARDVVVTGNVTIKYDPAYEYLNGQ